MDIKLYQLFNCRCLATCERWLSKNPMGTKAKAKECEIWKENFAGRQLLSKASGERAAIQKQSKMTKRRVKRRKQISAKCKTLFAEDLTEFIKRLKQQFPNSFWNIHDVVAQPERLILVRWMNWETEWKTSWKPHVFGNDFKPVWCMKCFLIAYS